MTRYPTQGVIQTHRLDFPCPTNIAKSILNQSRPTCERVNRRELTVKAKSHGGQRYGVPVQPQIV